MHELYNLKEMLVEELARYGESQDLSLSTLEIIDKLAHAAKNVEKVIECYDEQSYSKRGYSDRNSMRNSYYDHEGGMSHRRGRAMNGRFVSRDSSSMVHQLRDMAENAQDERTRSEIERLAEKIESM